MAFSYGGVMCNNLLQSVEFPHLLMLLHRGIELLGQIISYIWHPRLFLIGSADTALVLVGLFVILLFGILAVSMGSLAIHGH